MHANTADEILTGVEDALWSAYWATAALVPCRQRHGVDHEQSENVRALAAIREAANLTADEKVILALSYAEHLYKLDVRDQVERAQRLGIEPLPAAVWDEAMARLAREHGASGQRAFSAGVDTASIQEPLETYKVRSCGQRAVDRRWPLVLKHRAAVVEQSEDVPVYSKRARQFDRRVLIDLYVPGMNLHPTAQQFGVSRPALVQCLYGITEHAVAIEGANVSSPAE